MYESVLCVFSKHVETGAVKCLIYYYINTVN